MGCHGDGLPPRFAAAIRIALADAHQCLHADDLEGLLPSPTCSPAEFLLFFGTPETRLSLPSNSKDAFFASTLSTQQ
jgi:hypothetical protein